MSDCLVGLEVHALVEGRNGDAKVDIRVREGEDVGAVKDKLLGPEVVTFIKKRRRDTETGESKPELDEFGVPVVIERRDREVEEVEAIMGHFACKPEDRVFDVLEEAGVDVTFVPPHPSRPTLRRVINIMTDAGIEFIDVPPIY